MQKTSSRIELLPDHLINQIAAGEVIERPASVVRELLDNSVDAGASRIVIDIEHGGSSLIRVRDDGRGIYPDDLTLALTRHATSKIHHIRDLQYLMTMGFRGEALPSIASVSRFSIQSAIEGQAHAWMIRNEGRSGHQEPEPVSHPVGTTVEVRDLFYNLPARRKYLRTERTEFYQIQQLVRHFALGHPELAIRLTHNGRQVMDLKPVSAGICERVRDVCGSRFLQQSLNIEDQIPSIKLSGFLLNPEAARTTSDTQFFCLNRRCIRDKRVNHAITQACQALLPEGRHLAYVLYLEIEPSLVDVNVHPAKTEVRFREGRTVHDFIYSAVRSALNGGQTVQPDQSSNRVVGSRPKTTFYPKANTARQNRIREYSVRSYEPKFRTDDQTQKESVRDRVIEQIGDVHLIRKEDELILIDFYRAMSALLRYELETYGKIKAKPLLFPRILDLEEAIVELLQKQRTLLERFGIVVARTESGKWQLRQLPEMITSADPVVLIEKLCVLLQQEPSESELIEWISEQVDSKSDLKQLLEQIPANESKGILLRLSPEDLKNLIAG